MTEKTHDRRHPPARHLTGTTAPEDDRERPDTADRARFARGIARAEFGRHYWNDRMTEELQAAMTRQRTKK